jgi:AraC-like DNA-binding protein
VGDPRIRATALTPSEVLRPFVRQFLVIENLVERTDTLLPDSGMVAGFRFQGSCAVHGTKALRAVVTGLRDTPRTLTHPAGSGTILAMFTATGAAAFLREPLENLFNTTMAMECEVRRSQLDLIEEQLAEAPEHAVRARRLEQFLLDQLRSRRVDLDVTAAVAQIQRTKGSLRIRDLAHASGLSQSALERRFRKQVGASPKKFANIVRMRHAVRLHASGANLTEVAYAAGYADQPHFIKDFKRFSGVAPETFFQNESAFC